MPFNLQEFWENGGLARTVLLLFTFSSVIVFRAVSFLKELIILDLRLPF